MNIFAKEERGRDGFVQSVAPSVTAAYFINGNALNSILDLPISTSKCFPLPGERLKGMQDTFSNVGLVFLDEKSMAVRK